MEKKVEANELFQAGKYQAACDKYSRILNNSSYAIALFRATVLCNRAACHLKLNTYGECVADVQRCLEVCDQHQQKQKGKCPFSKLRVKALFRRAEARVARGQFQQAAADYEEILSKTKNKTVALRYKNLSQQLPNPMQARAVVINMCQPNPNPSPNTDPNPNPNVNPNPNLNPNPNPNASPNANP